jgi:hypothetical protein
LEECKENKDCSDLLEEETTLHELVVSRKEGRVGKQKGFNQIFIERGGLYTVGNTKGKQLFSYQFLIVVVFLWFCQLYTNHHARHI